MDIQKSWLALAIGNSRLHWAWFVNSTLEQTWDTPYLAEAAIATLVSNQFDFSGCPEAAPPSVIPAHQPHLWIASVVPSQIPLWQPYSKSHVITLEQVPLQGLYPTLGIDRALAAWGAVKTWGLSALVIDAGTALTFTGVEQSGRLVGGAILPGLQLQMRTLAVGTAALPMIEPRPALPSRWALNTPEAIYSGVIYTALAGIQDFVAVWQQQFPESAIAFTGGDAPLLLEYLNQLLPELAAKVTSAPQLIFQGIQSIVTYPEQS